jgi:5'-nucleotidase / UDP-sugar diphosphatase
MRKFLPVLLATTLLTAAAQAETVKITLLGAGDVYNFDGSKTRGGVARLNAVAKAERAANPNTLYLFDGDMLSPSLLSGFDKGENMVVLTNMVPFDLAVPGNHEFDFGPENFTAKAKMSKYPWSAINIATAEGKPLEGLGGVVVKDVAGVKIALIPIAQDSSPEVSNTGTLKFADSVKTGVDAAKKARADGADLVVAVAQTPHSQDYQLIASKAFDVILSGDDHDLAMQWNGITAYVETSIDANYLTPVDLTVNIETKDGKRNVSWHPNFRFIDTATVQPDPETQAQVDKYKADLSKELDVAIGKTEAALDSRRNMVRGQETGIGNVIADALRAAVGADIAIINGGGIRGDKQYEAGKDITRKDVLSELPFGNKTVLIEATGKQIWDALENGFSKLEDGAGRFPQVSGMTIVADKSKPAGNRVVEVKLGDKPLDPAATYKLATNDFMLAGGDGYTSFAASKVIINAANGKLMANDVLALFKAKGVLSGKVEGRITLK